ncbi:MAG: hypothetical protein K2M75_05010 [Clostridia bacterium]|nr:hypothetical protein [Clostridia bacterium]
MKIYLYNRKDIKVFQNSQPLKINYKNGREYVEPQVDEQGRFEVEFVKKSEFSGGLWFIKALLFWIIGIMGFFTPKYAKCNHSLDCKVSGVDGNVPLNVSFIHPNPKYGVCAGVKLKEEGYLVEGAEYILDKKSCARKKFYSFLSGIARLAVIVLAVVLIIKAIIG